jgi:hypothetical protein
MLPKREKEYLSGETRKDDAKSAGNLSNQLSDSCPSIGASTEIDLGYKKTRTA